MTRVVNQRAESTKILNDPLKMTQVTIGEAARRFLASGSLVRTVHRGENAISHPDVTP